MNKTKSIPKIIHYCWFGRKEKPEIVKKCINSWRENLKEYEIREWNEDSFSLDSNEFVREAYEHNKFAFVSDYVRVYALYNYGGIYLDTDVEVNQSFDKYLNDESFWGFEAGNYIATSTIGTVKESKVIKKFLDSYEGKKFINEDGTYNTITNVRIVSSMFEDLGVKLNGEYQKIEGIGSIYPMQIFSPYDYRYYQDLRNINTVCIHYYYKSWLPLSERIKQKIKKTIIKLIGVNQFKKLNNT